VHDDDICVLPDLLFGESAPIANGNAHCAEVIGRDAAAAEDRLLTFENRWAALDDDRIGCAIASHEQRKADGRGLHSRQGLYVGKRLLKETDALSRFAVAA